MATEPQVYISNTTPNVRSVFRLPPEILAVIFVHGARDHYETVCCHELQLPSWVNVSYVCRRWRNIALDCTTLWTYHFATWLPHWTDRLLARSKQALLKIRICVIWEEDERWWSRFVEKIMAHVERIQDLRIHHPYRFYLPLLSSRAPHLENLEIIEDGDYFDRLSPVPFNGDTPALRTLKLSECALPWYSLDLSRLTTLCLHHIPPFQLDAVEFLSVLNHAQDLTDLYLDFTLIRSSEFRSIEMFSKTNFPRLARFLLIAPLSTVVTLLSSINITPKTLMRLTILTESDAAVDDYALILGILAQRLGVSIDPASPDPAIRSLFVQFLPWGSKFGFSTLEHCSDVPTFHPSIEDKWDSNILLSMVLHVFAPIMSTDGNRIISDICSSVPAANVHSLHVCNPTPSLVTWRSMLGHLQELRYIKLSRGYMPDLTSLLSLTAHDPMDTSGQNSTKDQEPMKHVFVPALEALELHDIQFLSDTARSCLVEDSPVSQLSLLDALATRDRLRDRVTMVGCGVSEDF